jgi:predicted MPP superfamily phosphohydrolase
MLNGYDIIGDIHGCADKLEALLSRLGYLKQGGVWKHADRIAVFLGDYIDRGPEILETLKIVRDMREAGAAVALMGNHEFNAVCWNTPDPAHPGQHLRPHNEKNRLQHEASLDQLAGCYQMWIA